MFCASPRLFQGRTSRLTLLLVGTLTFIVLAADPARAQRRTTPAAEPEDQPAFAEFKGVRLGMTADEARKKLGSPRIKDADQDLYVFNDTQAVQVFYDKAGAVSAISIDFMSGANSIPSAKEVLGSEADTRKDGSVYKMLRYPKAGYWVSYSRTAGNFTLRRVSLRGRDQCTRLFISILSIWKRGVQSTDFSRALSGSIKIRLKSVL